LAVAAIASGNAALSKGDSRGLAEAERLLSASGARAAGDAPDVIVLWRKEAKSKGLALPPRLPPLRGRVLGSAYKQALLTANKTMIIEQTYLAGQKAQISLIPSSGAQLSVAVMDGDGRTVCRREAAARPASCSWMPLWTSRYRIEVRNAAPRPAAAFLVID
jgi:hypothetical protein